MENDAPTNDAPTPDPGRTSLRRLGSGPVGAYLADVVDACAAPRGPLVSLVLFGSAATGGYSPDISDVDLLLVLEDDADTAELHRVTDIVRAVEARHGLARRAPSPSGTLADTLEAFAARITANVRAFFVCRRADLLSGDPARILSISRVQAAFVDRVAIPTMVSSGVTVWGEELLTSVPLPAIRRLDVAKAWFGLFNQTLFAAAVYPFSPWATKYAMDALKRSVHNCYFYHHGRAESLEREIAFFQARYQPQSAMTRLMTLRSEYAPSFGFVIGCLPTLVKLHLRTARDVRFPRSGSTVDSGRSETSS
jgi:hypothetical protein